ncbi:MAG: 30S ribosomal protein S20, partial [Chloroflexota bacterium]
MPNTKSAEKRWRQSLKRRLRNRAAISRARTFIRATLRSIQAGQPDPEKLRQAIIALDKAAEKGIIHKNNAARRKSRLMSLFARVTAGETVSVTEQQRSGTARAAERQRQAGPRPRTAAEAR